MQPTSPRPGRPSKPPKAGKKMTLGVRASPDLKRRLDRAAKANDRSLTQEMERRLERSFDQEQAIALFNTVHYGRRLSQLLQIIGRVMQDIGPMAAFEARGAFGDWLDDPASYDRAKAAATATLDALRPPGDPSPPAAAPYETVHAFGKVEQPSFHERWEKLPHQIVAMYLRAITGDRQSPRAVEFVSSLGDLGPFVERATKAISEPEAPSTADADATE